MTKGRLEAFSDGVIAVIITIMVLEIKVPQGAGLEALRPVFPAALTYLLSFVFVGIYWNNHHHMLQATRRINGAVLWANLHLLFWLSLVPLAAAWMGQNHLAGVPTACYGVVLLMCAVAYTILTHRILIADGAESLLHRAIGAARKERVSLALYAFAVAVSFRAPAVAQAVYVLVAVIWFVPDKRIERVLQEKAPE
jgi:uncharacterized membrane protein